MKSHARIVATFERGRVVFSELRSAPPLTLRRIGPREIAIVSSAAWPVGDDDVALDIVVEPGVDLTVSSVAASIAYPSPTGTPSSFTIRADVAAGGTLRWLPEPMVLAARCDHRSTASIRLDDTAALTWRDEVRLGRTGEPTGSLRQRTVIDRGDRPLVRNEVTVGPAWPATSTSAVLGPHRVALATAYSVGPATGTPRAGANDGSAWAENPHGHNTTAWSVVGGSMSVVRNTLADLIRDHNAHAIPGGLPAVADTRLGATATTRAHWSGDRRGS